MASSRAKVGKKAGKSTRRASAVRSPARTTGTAGKRKLEEQLRDYESQLAALGKSQAVIEFAMDGTILTANENFLGALGYSLDEIQGRHHSMFVDEATRMSAAYKEFWAKLNRGEFQAGEFKRVGKGGKEVWIQASYNPILGREGRPVKVVKFASDVTEMVAFRDDAVGQISAIGKVQAVIAFNMDGTILTANDNFLSVMGYTLGEIQGRHHSMFVDEATRVSPAYKEFWAALNRGEFQTAEYKRIGKGGKEVWIQASYNPILDREGRPVKVVKFASDVTEMVRARETVRQLIDAAIAGRLEERADVSGFTGTYRDLVGGVNEMLDNIVKPLQEGIGVLDSLSRGDLTKRVAGSYRGDLDTMKSSINNSIGNLAEMVEQIRLASDSITQGSEEISKGNQDLSQRMEEQASSLEETAASMEEMSGTIQQNADNSKQANQLAIQCRGIAEKGGAVVARAVSSMSEINSASKKIADIIGVIDEIAFQTNLLALNAAVEAARAGEQGRGFAVVAAEVRNLAQRSATAAKEIKTLIQDSVQKVQDGSGLVNESGATLEEVVASVKRVADIIGEISAASQEQASGVEQVNKAVSQLDQITQQNAALVEETAAASEGMAEQAKSLRSQVGRLQLDQDSERRLSEKLLDMARSTATAKSRPAKGNGAARNGLRGPATVATADSEEAFEEF
jgi:methyl-accepting chemotaxis protein